MRQIEIYYNVTFVVYSFFVSGQVYRNKRMIWHGKVYGFLGKSKRKFYSFFLLLGGISRIGWIGKIVEGEEHAN
ncbi:hypothetical protein AUK10_03790 [Candidatus Gracilibacteria bacterium CG2_30_37_12]|nr:MAG: hypothetical protein AUK10_03790 [Candidatus Gracilibacteria bacterium CG2_30_37_12]